MAGSAGTIFLVGFYVGSTWRHITDKLTVSFYSRMRVLIKYEHNRSLWQSGYLTVLFCNEKIERQRKKEKRKRKKEKRKRKKEEKYSKSSPNLLAKLARNRVPSICVFYSAKLHLLSISVLSITCEILQSRIHRLMEWELSKGSELENSIMVSF